MSSHNSHIMFFGIASICGALLLILGIRIHEARSGVKWQHTNRELFLFGNMCEFLHAIHPDQNGMQPTLPETLNKLSDLDFSVKNRLPLMTSGYDAWGHPFVYHWLDGKNTLMIYSLGNNGRDDNGAGDDLVCKRVLGGEVEKK